MSDLTRRARRAFVSGAGALGFASLWPARVAALNEGEPSLTARSTATQRAAHQLIERPLVFEDPVALSILGAARVRALAMELDRFREPSARSMRAALVVRSRFAEDELAQAYARGVRQYLVLGAGLDTFAYRNRLRGLRVFEVDHPSTQRWKLVRLKESGIALPRSLKFVPVDFERQSLAVQLRRFGFRFDRPVFVSWLGVTMYLTEDAVYETFRFVAQRCASGSEIVFDYSLPAEDLPPAQRGFRARRAAQVERIGEPWVSHFSTDVLVGRLRDLGFDEIDPLDTNAANARYFAGRDDGFRLHGSSRLMAARTARR